MNANKQVICTGFEGFGSIARNPSSELLPYLQEALIAQNPGFNVTSMTLPVSYSRAPTIITQTVEQLTKENSLALLLGFGVHRGDFFRLESCAHPKMTSSAMDVDQQTAADYHPLVSETLTTDINIPSIIAEIPYSDTQAFKTVISHNCSGYVCEAVYHHLLALSQRFACKALFVHVPHAKYLSVQRQGLFLAKILQPVFSSVTLFEQ